MRGLPGGNEEITECLLVVASHASAQLVQLAETEVLRVVDEDCVDVGHVYAVLHYGGGEKHVVIMGCEVDNRLFKFLRGICPWAVTIRIPGTSRRSVFSIVDRSLCGLR